jgi:hypothetical protein
MATLGKILKSSYDARFAQRLFYRDKQFSQTTTYTCNNQFAVTFDRVKGGTLRLFLIVGIHKPQIEAESPWWHARDESRLADATPEIDAKQYTLETALSDAWHFLETCGFEWLKNPHAMTPTLWREKHNLLVTDHRQARLTLKWPAAMPLNERIIRAKNCVPAFQGATALQLRNRFIDVASIPLGLMPLANAMELKLNIEQQGLLLEIQPVEAAR